LRSVPGVSVPEPENAEVTGKIAKSLGGFGISKGFGGKDKRTKAVNQWV